MDGAAEAVESVVEGDIAQLLPSAYGEQQSQSWRKPQNLGGLDLALSSGCQSSPRARPLPVPVPVPVPQ